MVTGGTREEDAGDVGEVAGYCEDEEGERETFAFRAGVLDDLRDPRADCSQC